MRGHGSIRDSHPRPPGARLRSLAAEVVRARDGDLRGVGGRGHRVHRYAWSPDFRSQVGTRCANCAYRWKCSAIIPPAKRPGAAPRSRGARPAVATRRAVGSVAGHQQPASYSPRAARSRAQRPRLFRASAACRSWPRPGCSMPLRTAPPVHCTGSIPGHTPRSASLSRTSRPAELGAFASRMMD
jgi:hypothetical protein